MSEVIDRQTIHALRADTRQEILKLLTKRPYTASELSRILNKHVTTVTEHLSVLEKSGVVKKRDSTNKWVYYALTDKGERFFKPNFTWVLMLGVSFIAIVAGFHQVIFVQYQASIFGLGEQQAMAANKAADLALTESTQVGDMNLYLGILALIAGGIFLWKGWEIRKKHEAHKLQVLHILRER